MRCRKARRLISARFDAELDQARQRAVGKHLAGCHGCRRFAGDLPRCTQALDLMTVPEPREGFTARVMLHLPQRPTKRVGLRQWSDALLPGTAAAAALALSCGVVLALWMNGGGSPQVSDRNGPAEALYAESFDALPGDSAGARYLALLQEAEK